MLNSDSHLGEIVVDTFAGTKNYSLVLASIASKNPVRVVLSSARQGGMARSRNGGVMYSFIR